MRLLAGRPDEGEDLTLLEHPVALLRRVVDAADGLVARLDAALLQPPDDVRPSRQRPDDDALGPPDLRRRHAGIDPVGEPDVALAQRLDHGGGVHAGAGLEGVATDDGVVARDRGPAP